MTPSLTRSPVWLRRMSAEALAKVLAELLCDPYRLTQMGKRASEWARETFAPERYACMAVARLM